MFGIGASELIIILVIVVFLFGAKRIPEIMGGVGKGIKSFKKSMETDDSPVQEDLAAKPAQATSSETPKAAKPIEPA